ncbi:DUF1289 domain-containing protein [Roseiconus nitratireducens]|uniref:DUF1289 domain-containing protein n=1 Tax=Roseiconus nitratireducens TaxID=2605748 RepID=A0A5M6CWE6_9BACT|nr:DUF1289 domain-containing protein [Roseiconus nitratireducens]KAA5539413.1 DUF1289 domain-containing protein [Roseiconus nitratireducens]
MTDRCNLKIASPCRQLCALASDGVCLGCGRTRAEIAIWTSSPAWQQRDIVSAANRRLVERRAALAKSEPSPAE